MVASGRSGAARPLRHPPALTLLQLLPSMGRACAELLPGHCRGWLPPRTPSARTLLLSLMLQGGCRHSSHQPHPPLILVSLLSRVKRTAPFYQPWSEGTPLTDPKCQEGRTRSATPDNTRAPPYNVMSTRHGAKLLKQCSLLQPDALEETQRRKLRHVAYPKSPFLRGSSQGSNPHSKGPLHSSSLPGRSGL